MDSDWTVIICLEDQRKDYQDCSVPYRVGPIAIVQSRLYAYVVMTVKTYLLVMEIDLTSESNLAIFDSVVI